MSDVYVVTVGEYSDKHNVAVCSTRPKAEEVVQELMDKQTGRYRDEIDYEVFELDELSDRSGKGDWWEVVLNEAGVATKVLAVALSEVGVDYLHEGILTVYVVGADVIEAIEAAKERCIKHLAEDIDDGTN